MPVTAFLLATTLSAAAPQTVAVLDMAVEGGADAVVSAFAAAGCGSLTANDSDYLLYSNVGGAASVSVSSAAGAFWRATATAPVTETISCQ